MPASRVSLSHIAERAKVSVMTVSRTLRGQGGVSPEVAARIRRLAETMGYQPNPLVQALMVQVRTRRTKSSSHVIGLLLPQFDDPAWGRQDWIRRGIRGAKERAQQAGFRLEVFRWQSAEVSDKRMDQILQARGVRGIVVAPLPRPGLELALDWSHYASAAIGATLREPRFHRVRHHAFHSIQLAVQKLHEAGCARVGLAQSDFTAARVDGLWDAGYYLATRNYSDRNRRELLHQATSLDQESFTRWVRRARPDGLVLQDNRCFAWLDAARIDVPGRVAVAHLNCNNDIPGVAGIDQEFEYIGAATVDLVVEQLLLGERGIPARPKDVLLEGVWTPGRTVADRAEKSPVPAKPASARSRTTAAPRTGRVLAAASTRP